MESYKYIFLAILLVGVCEAAFKAKRSPVPQPSEQDDKTDPKKEPAWKPVSEPQSFSVMVDDNINKANQFRHETWKPGGTIEGEYATPTRDGKWMKVSYVADQKGFRITKQETISEDQVNQPTGGAAADHQAKVETHFNGKDTQYTVKDEDLQKAKQKQQQDSKHGGL